MVEPTLEIETLHWNLGKEFICGIDEVGRGCFAGPVVAGAVIFPKHCRLIPGVADSKFVSPKKRKELESKIKELAVCWGIGLVEVEIINKIGIGKATHLAYLKAIEALTTLPDFVLIDAFFINGFDRDKQQAVKDGDSICGSIAAASIIAKVFRDELMETLDSKYANYGFSKHKGYGTKFHQQMIKKYGLSDLHRRSFNLEKFC